MAIEISRRLSPERRIRILDAARHLILRQGLRTTTMEAIAREARIAKPTLYAYFPDKEAVFSAIVQTLADDIVTAFDSALDREGEVVTRIAAALTAKYETIGALLEGSPHAGELYSEHDRTSVPALTAIERSIEEKIAAVLVQAGSPQPLTLTRLLVAAAYGVARKTASPAEIGPALGVLVERLVRPELTR